MELSQLQLGDRSVAMRCDAIKPASTVRNTKHEIQSAFPTKEGPDSGPSSLRTDCAVIAHAIIAGLPESALGALAVLCLVLDLFADLLRILARAHHGVASGQRAIENIETTINAGKRFMPTPPGNGCLAGCRNDRTAASSPAHKLTCRAFVPRERGCQCSASTQSRISVDLPNRLSTRSTTSSAVRLRISITGFSSTMSSDSRRPVSAIISITSCASR